MVGDSNGGDEKGSDSGSNLKIGLVGFADGLSDKI